MRGGEACAKLRVEMSKRAIFSIVLAALAFSGGCADPAAAEDGGGAAAPPASPADDAPKAAAPSAPAPADPPKPAPPACTPLAPRAVPLEVAALPDAREVPFVSAIQSAKTSVRVMVYQMGFGPILDALKAKASAGVDVRVILDVSQADVNQKYMDQLAAAGAKVIWSDPAFTYMHAKVIMADDAVAVISTGNYSQSYLLKERNYVATDRDPQDVAVLTKLFDADYARKSPSLDCTRLLVSPVNAKERLLALIASAKTSLVVHSMQFADWDVRRAVVARKDAGVDVRVLLASPSWIDANASAATYLADHGVAARWLDAPSVHVKAIVVDGKAAYLGSENLSTTSLTKNREVGLVTDEAAPVTTISATFEKDWAIGHAF